MLAALIVVVTAIGGPSGIHRSPNAPMPGSVIEITQSDTGLTATTRLGSFDLLLPRGGYTVVARVGPGTPPCGTKRVHLGRHRTRLHFFCSIK